MAHTIEHRADPNREQPGYLPGSDYATPYSSQFSRAHPSHAQLLESMNCGYLSTHGVAPTLLALKQHAQSLAYLISLLNPTVKYGEVGPTEEADKGDIVRRLEKNEAFDWLTNLTEKYENDDPGHNKPLNFLLNDVKDRHDVHGTEYNCPLTTFSVRKDEEQEPLHPYANHHNLILHANACLERLDHEFSSTGGLLSLLPTELADVESSQNSLLGQWLLYTQQLVGRMHELELAYGGAVDALRDRAVAPLQHMSALGPDGRSGRELGYPQDRYVLVNAGDDVFDYVHGLLDQKEAVYQAKERVWRAQGVSGERMWFSERAGDVYARGIVAVELRSRFYRLTGHGRSTLFVIPAWERHPGVAHTARLLGQQAGSRPTVVASVQPTFPPRATELEKRYRQRLDRADQLEDENAELQGKLETMGRELLTAKAHLERETAANRAFHAALFGKGSGADVTGNGWPDMQDF